VRAEAIPYSIQLFFFACPDDLADEPPADLPDGTRAAEMAERALSGLRLNIRPPMAKGP